ncbi:MAG: penicillin acylase family protein [Deltaproteobacteria bacterium]|nr:MAG: penicillin acylase family protein [Deltaproteobacteria bacterium]
MRSTRRSAWILGWLGFAALVSLGVNTCGPTAVEIPGLSQSVNVTTDANGVWHIEAANDLDLAIAQGYVHCRDRFFQMDDTRRQVDGTEAELLGPGRLAADIQARVIGLHRAAQRSLDAAPGRFRALLDAYADGVNYCLATLPLPPEYAQLELTQARPWEAVDTIKIGKAIAASLSLDVDTGLTQQLAAYLQAGGANGFDGQALFSQDVFRSAPIDPASTIPDATNTTPYAVDWSAKKAAHIASVAKASGRVREKLAAHPLFALALDRRASFVGSNEWGVTGAASANGRPMIANDPHLSLNVPSTFWEWHLTVRDDPEAGPMNVSGVGFPGAPGVILGQNEHITWGATTNPMDVSDVFSDRLLVAQPACFAIGALACIESPPGTFHAVEIEFNVRYFFNSIGDSVNDNLVEATGLPTEATTIGTVPFRSFGPIIDIENPAVLAPPYGTTTALVLQYTGFHATQELVTFSIWNRAADLAEFQHGLDFFDVGSQNWAYADRDGNLAYFTSAEMPLRTDLEQGAVVGLPPFFVRDGLSGANNWIADNAHSQGQTIPFAILPAAEMPHTINPANAFFVNANNDPAGTTLDNDPLNQVRVSSATAIYYLNPSYQEGLRAGRITRLIQGKLSAGGTVSMQEMKDFQGNTQQLDAELLVPFLLDAFANAAAPGAPPELASLAGQARIAEAIGRLSSWDFSGPTGIEEGWDASDVNGKRSSLSGAKGQQEIAASVASTIYNLWRGYAIRTIVDVRLAGFGLGAGSDEALKALHHLLGADPYTGIAAAGFDWIPQPSALTAEQRRDLALLGALRDALDALASPAFAPAFAQSTNQNDYRWGKLHRIVFDHLFDPSLSIPPQGGFTDLSPQLRGISRDGGMEVVNASGYSARSIGLNNFMFGSGPVRRYVGRAETDAIIGVNSVPGGPSGIPGDPDYATQLATWLTADYHNVHMDVGGSSEVFLPSPAP